MVLDGVVRTSRKPLCHFRPTAAHCSVTLEDQSVFFLGPRILVDAGIEMVVPPLTTLLPNASCRYFIIEEYERIKL